MQKAPCYFGSSHSPILQIRKPQSLFLRFSPLLLILTVLLLVVYYFVSESAGIQVLIFASMARAKVADIEAVARAVLPKFYCSDLHPESWRVFSACGRRCVLTANPSVMVEAFLKEYVGADVVIGTKLVVWRGRATGLVCSPGVLVGEKKADALRQAFGDATPEKIEEGAGLVRKEREEKQQRANQAGRQANQRGSVATA